MLSAQAARQSVPNGHFGSGANSAFFLSLSISPKIVSTAEKCVVVSAEEADVHL